MSRRAASTKPVLIEDGEQAVVAVPWKARVCGIEIEIEAGYTTDGATFPSWLRWLCGSPMAKPRLYAAAVHDWLYDAGICSRLKADLVYLELCCEWGVFPLDAFVQFFFIRLFGGKHFCKAA